MSGQNQFHFDTHLKYAHYIHTNTHHRYTQCHKQVQLHFLPVLTTPMTSRKPTLSDWRKEERGMERGPGERETGMEGGTETNRRGGRNNVIRVLGSGKGK